MDLLLKQPEIDVNEADPDYNMTALLWACELEKEEIGMMILGQEGVNITVRDNRNYILGQISSNFDYFSYFSCICNSNESLILA